MYCVVIPVFSKRWSSSICC